VRGLEGAEGKMATPKCRHFHRAVYLEFPDRVSSPKRVPNCILQDVGTGNKKNDGTEVPSFSIAR